MGVEIINACMGLPIGKYQVWGDPNSEVFVNLILEEGDGKDKNNNGDNKESSVQAFTVVEEHLNAFIESGKIIEC